MPPATVAEIGCVVKAGAFGLGVGVGVGVTLDVTMTS